MKMSRSDARKCLKRTVATAILASWVVLFPLHAKAQSQNDSQAATASEAATKGDLADMSRNIDNSMVKLQNDNEHIAATIRTIREDIERKIDEQGASTTSTVGQLRSSLRITVTAQVIIALIGIFISLAIFLKLPRLAEAVENLRNLPVKVTPSASTPPQNTALTAALSRIEERLSALSATVVTNNTTQDATKTAHTELIGKLLSIEETLRTLPAMTARSNNHSDGTNDALWPESLRSNEEYPKWKKGLGKDLEEGKAEAQWLAAALLNYQAGLQKADGAAEDYVRNVKKLGESAYAYCHTLESVELANRLEIASALLRVVRQDSKQHAPEIEVKAFFPNEKLNTETMEKLDDGNRLSVSRPLSWLIIERNNGRERIIHRAQVITG